MFNQNSLRPSSFSNFLVGSRAADLPDEIDGDKRDWAPQSPLILDDDDKEDETQQNNGTKFDLNKIVDLN